MSLTRNKLYLLLLVSCAVGYSWILYNFSRSGNNDSEAVVCLIKHVTGVPCPSCGATRSVMSFYDGRISEALYLNPIGLILFLVMTISPIWIAIDYLRKRDSLYIFYKRAERLFQKRIVAIPAIILVIGNWVWNIIKDV